MDLLEARVFEGGVAVLGADMNSAVVEMDTDKLVLDGSKFWVSRTKIGEEKMGVRIEMARSEGSGSGNWRRREVSD